MANPLDLNDLLTRQTQFQAAKSGSGGLLDMILSGYQAAFPKAPAANLLQGARQAYNIGKYNKAVQAESQRQLLEEQAKQGEIAGQLNRLGLNVGPRTRLKTSEWNDILPNIGKQQANETYQQVLRGEAPTFGALADPSYAKGLIEYGQSRRDKSMDAETTQRQLQTYANSPQFPGAGGYAQQTQAQPMETQSGLQLDPSVSGLAAIQQGQPLQAGVSAQQPISPLEGLQGIGIPDISSLLSGRNNEQTDRRGNKTIAETIRNNTMTSAERARHNKAQEAIARYNSESQRISATKPSGGGGSGNPFTIPNAAQNFVQGQIQTLEARKKALIDTAERKGFYVSSGDNKGWKPDKGEQNGVKMASPEYNSILSEINAITRQQKELGQQVIGTPFGGQSQKKLQSGSNKVSAPISSQYKVKW